jgi:radical SAM superfamily enzyme YgiQ (UPF0313 family)
MAYDSLLTEQYLNGLRLPMEFSPTDPRYPHRWLLTFRDELASRVENAKVIMRTASSFFDAKQYLFAENTLRYSLFLISLSFWPQKVGMDMLDLGVPSSDLFSTAQIGRSFGSFVFEDVMEQILASESLDKCDVVGFSVHTKFQLFYSLRLIRRYFPRETRRAHVTLGGTFLSSLQRYYTTFQPIFDGGADTIVYGHGEETLAHLCRLVADGKSPSSCSGVIYSDGRSVHKSHRMARGSDPVPLDLDYADLFLEKYMAPASIVNIPASTGCYWGKCRFCNYHDVYSVLDPARLSSLLERMGRVHETSYFFLAQSTLNYEQVMALPTFSSHHSAYVWGSLARIDEQATVGSVAPLYAAGCRKLSLGLETRSPALREKMHKGHLSRDFERFLRLCHDKGIGIEIFLIVGYPGETLRDVRQTLGFIRRFLPYIDTLSANQFSLVCNSVSFTTMLKKREYILEEGKLSFYDVMDQHRTWRYRDGKREILHQRRVGIFWKGLIDIIEESSSHIWRGNTASRCGFPRLPEHHFLYCASRDQLRHLEAVASVQQQLVPLTIGDQIVSVDFETMTVANISDES